ncbi:MAG: hypothetical protein CYPHOPRED_002851 [Cyphobasidiales sp. Tagirdzhanova-0007]|nr:MAG: hypothetical protein CYPHOPRED_002851 [Cyphobasidiales sp. Tagirdzhanova-0007]
MHTFHNSGLIHPKICIVTPAKEGKGVLVTLRKGDAPQGQIAKAAETKEFTGGKSTRQTNKAIGEMLQSYRPDRKSLAIARARGILASQRKPKESKARRERGQKSKAAAAKKKST